MSDIFDQIHAEQAGMGGDIFDQIHASTMPQGRPALHNDAMGGPPRGYVEPVHTGFTGAMDTIMKPGPVANFMIDGMQQAGRGAMRTIGAMEAAGPPSNNIPALLRRVPNTDWSEVAGGVSDMGRGVSQAALPILAAPMASAAVAAPVATALGIGGGMLAQRGVESGMNALGVKPGYSQAAGDIAGILGGYGAATWGPKVLNSIPPPSITLRNVKNVNNPTVEQALSSVEKEVRMTPGQRAGQAALDSAERDLVNKPGTASEAQAFYAGAQDDLAAAGARRVRRQPGETTNPYGAGEGVQERLAQRGNDQRELANKLYDSTRQTTARNTQNVQTGVKEVPASIILDESGHPAIPAHEVPEMTQMETPVDLQPIRAQLKPVFEDLTRTLPEARRANSPAYRALEELMSSKDQQMNAMDFDKFLGAVKSITRDGTSSNLTTQSQGLAKQVVKAGEAQFQKAVEDAGPNVLDKLQKARLAVRGYHDTFELLDDLRSEPAALYQNLTTGGDRVRNLLGDLKNKAPNAVNTVGKTYLNEMMDKATREGGFGRSAGVKADWDRLGPETKALLFDPKVASDMDDFLLAAKKLTPERGSATADRLSALHAYGDIGMALAEFLGGAAVGHPLVGGAAAAGTLAKTRVMPRILADMTFKPAGAQLLKQAITLPVGSAELDQTMRALAALTGTTTGARSVQPPPPPSQYPPDLRRPQ